MNADGRRARAVVDTLPGHGCKPLCGACKVTLDGAIAAALAAERRRALLGLARWAHKWLGPDHLDDDDRVIFIAALECAAREARRRARGKA